MKVVFGSGNKGKLKEVRSIGAEYGFEILSPEDLVSSGVANAPIPDPEETADDYVGNAKIKAESFSSWSGMPSFADDSGLEVEALGGEPGVFSARYAGPGCSFEDNIHKLLAQMSDTRLRDARFYCSLYCVFPDGRSLSEVGTLSGSIVDQPRGDGGFGYDPVFSVAGTGKTLAELKREDPQTETHRTRALHELFPKLRECFEKPPV